MNLSRTLKQLFVFVMVFLLGSAFVGNPFMASAFRSSRVVYAALSSSTSSSDSPSSSSSKQFSTIPTIIPAILSEARSLGSLSPDAQLSFQLVLPLRDSVGLQSFIGQLCNPNSPFYRHFLTPSQFYSLYGPDQAEVTALTTYVQSNGLQIRLSGTNPNVAEVRGTVSQIQDALKTQIDSFSWNGRVFYSATSQAQLPSRFSNVQMIYGLEDFDSQRGGTGAVPLYRTLGTVTPGQTENNFLYYSPSEIRQMYNATSLLNAGYNGTDVSIAIVDAYGDPYIQQELKNFSAEFGLPLFDGTLHIIPVGPYNPWNGITYGWSMEVALDVEWAHAMAPNATINFYVASDSGNYLYEAVLNATLGSNGTAYGVYHNNIISMSWGEPENDFGSSAPAEPSYGFNYPWLDQVFQMDAALGITAFASSGDAGAYDQTYGQTSPYGGASYPSTDPYVAGVGGTSLYMNTTSGYYQWPVANATGTYGNETAWNWNNYYGWGTGGGWSTLFGQPSWQTGPGVVNNGERGNPDVAWDADVQTGVLVSVFDNATASYDYYIVGGTSVGSPSWAGSMALIDQKAGGSLGFVNPTIYSILNNGTEYSKAFRDVTVGNNNPYSATRGWDPLTGVGSPNLGELADYLSPTGQLPVIVTNDFSHVLSGAYAYGQTVKITAVVSNNRTISGPVTATITSSTGATIASNIGLNYNAPMGAWLGSYTIGTTDPSGEWSVTVTATNASSFGKGYTTFAVGDGVTIVSPPPITGQFYQIGDTIYVDSYVVDASGNNVTNGVYTATFYLAESRTAGNALGEVQGTVPLEYNVTEGLWEGYFTVPSNAAQGAWIAVVSGTDLNGNGGSAYAWINVGLDVFPLTDSPTYVLGDTVSIFAYATYEDGSEAGTGVFTAMMYDGSVFVAKVQLTFTFVYSIGRVWSGVFALSSGNPTGFYTITVNGTDGMGNSGSFATVVRVALYRLNIRASLSNPVLPLQDGNESWVLAKVAYPGGGTMTVGNVVSFIYLNLGGGVTSMMAVARMTYNSVAGGFITINPLHMINATTWLIGNYTVDVEAYDASGNQGNGTASFWVTGTNHAPINIANDGQFTPANGVIEGNGTYVNPYLIAGWNVSSISITGVTSTYELFNDYVTGSTGNGITILTPYSEPIVFYVHTVRNKGNGLYADGSPAGIYYGVMAGNNGENGILIANDAAAEYGGIESSVAYNNALNGIVYQSSSRPLFVYDAAVDNTMTGLLSQDSKNTCFFGNLVMGDGVGIKITAQPGSWYGVADIQGNEAQNNSVGIYVDGLDQNLITASIYGIPSHALIYSNLVLQNKLGIYAVNQAVIDAEGNIVAKNSIGISTVDSLAYLYGYYSSNMVLLSSGNGIQIVGQSAFDVQGSLGGVNGTFGTVVYQNIVNSNVNSTLSSGSAISVSDVNSSLIVGNRVAFSGGDGIELYNVSGGSLRSVATFVLGNTVLNNTMNGMEANNVSGVGWFSNDVEGNTQNGIEINGGSSNAFAYNHWAYNGQDGMFFNGGSSQDYVYREDAEFNHNGYVITQAGWNTLDYVSGDNNSGTANSPGAGAIFGPGAFDNYMFGYSMLNHNDVGVEFNSSRSNVVQGNGVWYNTMYGFYFVNGSQNDYTGNSLLGNGAPEYPTPPSLLVTWPFGGSTVNGIVTISWNSNGQSLAYTTVTIDGALNIATGASFSWNTTGLPDGEHTINVTATDTGGFSASQMLYLFTNNQLLATEATIAKLQLEVSNVNQTLATSINSQVFLLKSEIASLNQTLTANVTSTVSLLESEIGSLNRTLMSSVASRVSLLESEVGSLNQSSANVSSQVSLLKFRIGSLNQSLTSSVASQISSLVSEIGSINATTERTRTDVNGLRSDYIVIVVIVVAVLAGAIVIVTRRRDGAKVQSKPS